MITTSKKILATCALLGIAAAAHAQLYIAAGSTGVTTSFNFNINPTLNQVSVQVDNTHLGVGGVTGTVTSFGFNIPTALVGTGSLLSYSGVPSGTWSYLAPYNLNNFVQDNGAGSGANVNGGQPNQSIGFGSTATFVFQYADFATVTGFLGQNGLSVKWQGLSTDNQSDEGFGNPGVSGGPVITPVPEASTYGLMAVASLMVGVFIRRKTMHRTALAPALAA